MNNKPLSAYLDDLEARLDPAIEDALLHDWQAFIDGEGQGCIFAPSRARRCPPNIEWPTISINEALDDFEAMALQQFLGCSHALEHGTGALPAVRCNSGTSILPSIFGAEVFIMAPELNTLPTSWPVGDTDAIEALVARGAPDLQTGQGGRTFEMAARFMELIGSRPNVSRYVHLYHPDLQGPMDVCELLWGSPLFLGLVDSPELAKALLTLVTETYVRFMRAWFEIVDPRPPPPCAAGAKDCGATRPVPHNENGWNTVHWSLLHKGRIMLRDDSAMNLSPAMFDEFIAPYNQRLLDELDGGALHFCGRGDHYIDQVGAMRNLSAVAMSQPHCNDMETIFRHTVDKGLKLLALPRDAADAAVARGRDLHGNVHCW